MLLLVNIVFVQQKSLPKTVFLAMLMRSKDLNLYLTMFPIVNKTIPLIYNEIMPK